MPISQNLSSTLWSLEMVAVVSYVKKINSGLKDLSPIFLPAILFFLLSQPLKLSLINTTLLAL